MTQPNTAQLLNQHILGDRASFPCGCVLGCEVRYPNRDWVYTDYAIHSCSEHPSCMSVHNVGGMTYVATQPQFVGKFSGKFDVKQELLYGPLEKKWLKPDGTRVTIAELEAAMEEALERIDQEEEEAVEQVFRSQHYDTLPLALMMDALKPSQGVQSEGEEKPTSRPEDEGKEHG